uniref:ryncolin-2-like n=1 Tax=Styela clava TaxID=7725 RepID=UPI0019398AAB|nr:ryncolin-2-like [Styela clava]
MNITPLIIVLLDVAYSDALSCVGCSRTACPIVSCPGSKVLDLCGCCDVCAKQEHESCGGPWDSEGFCDTGLACLTTDPESYANNEKNLLPYPALPFDQSAGTCTVSYKNCNEVCDHTNIFNNRPIGFTYYGRNAIFIDETNGRGIQAYCDCSSEEHRAWTVIQRRTSNKVNFDRTWEEYESGFGLPLEDYWIGLQMLHTMTEERPCEMEINVQFKNSYKTTAKFGSVTIGSQKTSYQMTFDAEKNKMKNEFTSIHDGMKFTAKDKDNDNWSGGNCAKWLRGGWWFNSCTPYNLNGLYRDHSSTADRITWGGRLSPDVEMVEIKIRPKMN